jgi:DNA-binding SARP family transcriptional activator
VDLLGGFEVRHDGRGIDLPASAQRLVAFLAIAGRPLRRLHVAGALWIDVPETSAKAALRTALWRTRQGACCVVEEVGGCLALAPHAEVDAQRTFALARRVVTQPIVDVLDDDELRSLWEARDLLPDWYEDWILVERERHRQLRLHALEAVSGALAAVGRHGEAVQAGLAAVADEPLRESAHRALIAVHLAEGNAAQALRVYERFRRTLRGELGLEPSLLMEQLVAPLHRRDVAVTTLA